MKGAGMASSMYVKEVEDDPVVAVSIGLHGPGMNAAQEGSK
jgi:hypothetical protein